MNTQEGHARQHVNNLLDNTASNPYSFIVEDPSNLKMQEVIPSKRT
jgi:hypothetical protein